MKAIKIWNIYLKKTGPLGDRRSGLPRFTINCRHVNLVDLAHEIFGLSAVLSVGDDRPVIMDIRL